MDLPVLAIYGVEWATFHLVYDVKLCSFNVGGFYDENGREVGFCKYHENDCIA